MRLAAAGTANRYCCVLGIAFREGKRNTSHVSTVPSKALIVLYEETPVAKRHFATYHNLIGEQGG
jgi:hypothetical protein